MLDISHWPFAATLGLFFVAGFVILIVGTRLARLADVLADRTGLGEAIAGGVLLGATTSASGTITSVTAALSGDADLAYSNALGGIAAQTAFLAVADAIYRRANLEHAAADASNLSQTGFLIILLSVPLFAALVPPVTLWGIHPASVVLIVMYVVGVKVARRDRDEPMWVPRNTSDTRADEPEAESEQGPSTPTLIVIYAVLVLIVCVAGYAVAVTGAEIVRTTGLASSVVGALMTATVTSLPELVTTIAAVRRGALQLAVGGIIGGNTFDVLFLSASDVAYREGSIYNAVDDASLYWAVAGIIITGVLLLGLIRRQRGGIGNIGVESLLILILYGFFAVVSATVPG